MSPPGMRAILTAPSADKEAVPWPPQLTTNGAASESHRCSWRGYPRRCKAKLESVPLVHRCLPDAKAGWLIGPVCKLWPGYRGSSFSAWCWGLFTTGLGLSSKAESNADF